MRTIYIIDGNNLFFKSAHVADEMTAPDGTDIGPLTTFCTMVHNIRRDCSPEYIVVTFDTGGHSGRKEIYPEYKAHREDHEAIDAQIPLAMAACRAMGLKVISNPKYEADDIIATYARLAEDSGEYIVTVVSSDKDLLQLVSDRVMRLSTNFGQRTWYGPDEVQEKYGLPPFLIGDMLALMGDKADNVPGVKGIGPKIAAELLNAHGDLEGVLAAAAAGTIPQKKRAEKLVAGAEDARVSMRLVDLQDVPIVHELAEFLDRGYNPVAAVPFFRRLGMGGFLYTLSLDLEKIPT